MLAFCYNVGTNSNRAFSGSLRAGQRCIILTVNFFTDAKADGQRTFTGSFRILADSHRNGFVRIVSFRSFTNGNRIIISC